MERKEVENTDMAMDSLDFVEVIMEVEKKTGKCIPDEALGVKPYHELTVGELINMIEVIDDVREESNLSSDLAMDPFDLLEVLMGIEEKMDIRISDDVFGDKSVDELTVGIFVDMLYDWVKGK